MADQGPEHRDDERPGDAAPDSGRPRRAPPTIDLDASDVTSETRGAEADPAPQESVASAEPDATASEKPALGKPETPAVSRAPISPWVIAPVSGAVAAALVIGVGWMLGWPPVQSAATPQVTSATVDALTARVAGVEAKLAKPAADTATTTQLATVEKSLAALRDQVSATRAQSEKLAGQISSPPSTPGETAAPAVDLSAITARLDALEQSSRSEATEIAQAKTDAKADDAPLRRVVVASLLDLSVRQGDAYAATLAAAKTLAGDGASLQPLESFASTGVPTAASLSRELLTLLPKLSPPSAEKTVTTGATLVDRLKTSAENLVHIERVDASGTDRNAVVARVTAAAQRNDSNEARRELKTLPAADRASVQSWIDKADARDAALAASRQFAADAMTALAKPAQ
jgi:hypothetical protein